MFEDEYLDSFMEDQLSGGPNFPYEADGYEPENFPEWEDPEDLLDDYPEWDPADDLDVYRYDDDPNPYEGTYSEE